MSENKPIVSIENLSHSYGSDWAIHNINFKINQKGIVGLLGSNGAGKSTTMNILCGIITSTEGTATIGGFEIKKNPIEAKKLIGFLPQKAPLYNDLTVNEYLRHCARLRLIPESQIKKSVDYAKNYCGVADYGNRLIGNLSGGYQQRVGIAQAIIHRPKLIVLDEPTNGLDPVQITEVRSLIREISKESAILLSTHILSEVQAVCEEIIMIEHGKMVFSGNLTDFNGLIKPNTLIAAMDSPPSMDELEATEGVTHVKRLDDQTIKLTVKEGVNMTKAIIELSVARNWGLSEIYLEKVSLDNIFAKLSNRELKN